MSVRIGRLARWIFIFLALYATSLFRVGAQTIRALNSGWTFSQSGKAEKNKAFVPGSVQADLLRLKKIPDPFLGLNEDKIAWIEHADWVYSKHFTITAEDLKPSNIELVFEGLDTYATVRLNGRQLIKTANMFRKWVVNVKPWLKAGSNTLEVTFHSIKKTAGLLAALAKIRYPADNEQRSPKISPFVRKAPFQFGWDFAPRLLTTGIWKPVCLQFYNEAILTDVHAALQAFDTGSALFSATAEVKSHRAGAYLLSVRNTQTGKEIGSYAVRLKKGINTIVKKFPIRQPKVWWPNGLGGQPLYHLQFNLSRQGKAVSTKKLTVGVRKIQVVNEPDSIGKSFYVKVNGRPVFIKGANFVPLSSMPGPGDGAKLKQLFSAMRESHFNMIRVWGGGMYESDEFYRLADENGIMVWQDFPFANTMYPADEAFLENIRQEAIQNIRRIRNHPSLALWCGNNEIAVGWQNWGWQKAYGYSQADSLELISGYKRLFQELLPELVSRHDPGRFYFHSSPQSNWGKPEDFSSGDNHYWGVYHGEAPFSAYETHIPRFNSEFGFQSFPYWNSLQLITGSRSPSLESDVLTKRQKSYKGNPLLKKYMDWYYQPPESAEEFVYLSQLQQAEGMKVAIEANRRAMPYNMGTLVWQLNDVWPAISWSAIEYSGQWKAAQYFIKKAYEPLIISVKEQGDSVFIYIVSDTDRSFAGKIRVTLKNMQGREIWGQDFDLQVKGNAVTKAVLPFRISGISDKSTMFLNATLMKGEKEVARAIHYFMPVKDLDLPVPKISCEISQQLGYFRVLMKSDLLAKNICLSISGRNNYHFSDNYFDMLPGKSYSVRLDVSANMEFLKTQLSTRTVKNRKK